MLRRGKFHAGHGLLFGTAFGLTLAGGHPWLLFGGGVLLGLTLALVWKVGRRALSAAESRLRRPEPEPAPAAPILSDPPAGVRDLRLQLFDRLNRDLTLLAATLPRSTLKKEGR